MVIWKLVFISFTQFLIWIITQESYNSFFLRSSTYLQLSQLDDSLFTRFRMKRDAPLYLGCYFLAREGVFSRLNIPWHFASFSVLLLDVAWSPALFDTVATMRHGLAVRSRKTRNVERYSIVKTGPHAPRNKSQSINKIAAQHLHFSWLSGLRFFFRTSLHPHDANEDAQEHRVMAPLASPRRGTTKQPLTPCGVRKLLYSLPSNLDPKIRTWYRKIWKHFISNIARKPSTHYNLTLTFHFGMQYSHEKTLP